jgi:hypothetical protein
MPAHPQHALLSFHSLTVKKPENIALFWVRFTFGPEKNRT